MFLRGKLQICHYAYYQILPFLQHAQKPYNKGYLKSSHMKHTVVSCKSVIDSALQSILYCFITPKFIFDAELIIKDFPFLNTSIRRIRRAVRKVDT